MPTLIFAGLSDAWLVSEARFETFGDVTSPGQAVRLLLSPFVVVALRREPTASLLINLLGTQFRAPMVPGWLINSGVGLAVP